MLYFAAFYSGGINSDIFVTYSGRLDDRHNTHFFMALCLVIAAVWTAAIDFLIALYCFVVSLPSSFHFPSSSKKENTHTLFHSLSLSLSLSLSQNLFHSQNLQTSVRRRPTATHPTCRRLNSMETQITSSRCQSRVSVWVFIWLYFSNGFALNFKIFCWVLVVLCVFFFHKIDCGFGFDFWRLSLMGSA